MSNSSLATYTKLSPNNSGKRNHSIDTITIHCTAGNKDNTAKQIVSLTRFITYDPKSGASCNYAVGGDGSVALSVDEANRSWCTSSGTNDHRAITIEVASNIAGTEVNAAAYAALLDLVTDICKRNGIKRLVWSTAKADRVGHLNGCNMTVHRDYANKSCPGEWLYSRHGAIAAEVNKRLGATTTTPPVATQTPAATATSYRVRVTSKELRIRKGPGTNYDIAQNAIAPGIYTIVAESKGTGSTKGWGKLKSGAGWISLDFATKL